MIAHTHTYICTSDSQHPTTISPNRYLCTYMQHYRLAQWIYTISYLHEQYAHIYSTQVFIFNRYIFTVYNIIRILTVHVHIFIFACTACLLCAYPVLRALSGTHLDIFYYWFYLLRLRQTNKHHL